MSPRTPHARAKDRLPAALNPGRRAAGRALLGVERGGHAEDLLAELAPEDPADRSLAWNLCLGVLRTQGRLDASLRAAGGRDPAELDAVPRTALRLGLFELKRTRTPPHAAIHQAVELCRTLGGARASGLINAVLRKALAAPLAQDPWLDLPPWLAARWKDGAEPWILRLSEPPAIGGVWRDEPLAELPTRPAEIGGRPVRGAFWLTGTAGAIPRLPGFAEGRWWVMDPAAAAVVDLAAPQPGLRVLDACAAPGGKSLRCVAAGAEVLAVDQSAARLARVEEASRRTGLPLRTRTHDWLQGPLPGGERFDLVLVDAPCTGLGTIRRHPEIRWRRLPSDPAAMALRQRQILHNAARHLADGGRLLYAVCSPLPEEGRDVVASLSGWQVLSSFSTFPPGGDEDAFQAFLLRPDPSLGSPS